MSGDGTQVKDHSKKTNELPTPLATSPATTPVTAPVGKQDEAGGPLHDAADTSPTDDESFPVGILAFDPFDANKKAGDKNGDDKDKAADAVLKTKIEKNVPAEEQIKEACDSSHVTADPAEIRTKMREQVAEDIKLGVLKPADLDKPPTLGSVLVGTDVLTAEQLKAVRTERNIEAHQAKIDGKPDPTLLDVLKKMYKDIPLEKIDRAEKFYKDLRTVLDRPKGPEDKNSDSQKQIDGKIEKLVPGEDRVKSALSQFSLDEDATQIRQDIKAEIVREFKEGLLPEAALEQPLKIEAVLVGTGAVTADELKTAVNEQNRRIEKTKADGSPEPSIVNVLRGLYKDEPERVVRIDQAENLHDALIGEISFDKLSPAKQKEVQSLRTLQGTIIKLSGEKGFFADEQERKEFLGRLSSDMGRVKPGELDKGLVFEKLPEAGKATQEGFEKLVRFLEKQDGAINGRFNNIDALQLKDVPDLKVEIVGRDLGILKSREQIGQEFANGNASLKIDTGEFKDVDKLKKNVDKVTDVVAWLGDVDNAVHDEMIERKAEKLSIVLESGIADGHFPPGWRRPEKMDKETWCSAVEQTINTYSRFTRIVEGLNHVKRADVGFQTDAFDNFPKPADGKKGISINYDSKDRATNVAFGDFMVTDISLLSEKNCPILAELNNWSDQYEADGKKALFDLLRAQGQKREDGYQPVPHDAIGYGKVEINQGFVNPDKHAWTNGERPPGEGWKHFNLMTYDMDIKNRYDKFGKLEKVLITPDTRYHEVPPGPLGYCNFVKFGVHSENQAKPLEYDPNQYVTVQTGPNQCEMIMAKDVAHWKAMQELKEFGSTAVVVAMDGAMVVSGGIGVLGARQMVKMGVKTAVVDGAEYLSTRAMTEIPGAMVKEIVKRQTTKGLMEIGLGLSGPLTHGAGSAEIPLLKTAGDLRAAWFITHGAIGMAGWFKAPEAAQSLLRGISPRMAGNVEGVVNSIRGTEATREAMNLAHTGALKNLGEGWLGAEKAVHRVFSSSENAFIGQFAWESSHMYNEYQKHVRPWAYDQAQKAYIQADLADPSAVQKFIEKGPTKREVLDLHLNDYKKALGPLSKESTDTIDGITARVKELSGADATDEQRQAYVKELMKHFRYSGEQMTDMRKTATEDYIKERGGPDPEHRQAYVDAVKKLEPHSEAEYIKMAKDDSANLDPKVRKMAALAALILTRDEKGAWPDVLATREVTSPAFSVKIEAPPPPLNPPPDWKSEPELIEKPAVTVKQDITVKELYDLVALDMHRDPDMQTRIQKAGVLKDSGVIAPEHYGSLLLTQLDGSQQATKQEQMRALVELGGTINKLEIEEYARMMQMGEQDIYTARGLTAGLTSTDLTRRLGELLPGIKDDEVKATAQFTLDFLKKTHLDAVDRQRFNDVFFKENQGISKEDYHKQLVDDMASQPKDVGGWERKLNASKHLLEEAITGGDAKMALDVYNSVKDCSDNSPYSGVKIAAVEALLAPGEKGAPPRLDALSELIKQAPKQGGNEKPDIKKEFLSLSLNLFSKEGIKDNPNNGERGEAARARERLINLMVPFIENSDTRLLRVAFEANLSSLIDRKTQPSTADPFIEVRAAATKALATLQVGNSQYLDIMKMSLDPKVEPSAIVRLEALGAVEKMVLNSKQRREILGPLATKDPDFAVQARLARYYRPEGNVSDATSQVSKQKVSDVTTEHDKPEITNTEVKEWFEKNHRSLLKHDSIFDYIDKGMRWTGFQFIGATTYSTTFEKEWNDFKDNAEHKGLFGFNDWTDDLKNKTGDEMLIRMEGVAAVEAWKAYRANVNTLFNQVTGNGSGGVVLGSGDRAHNVTDQQAAIYGLGYLLRSGPQMGDAFYKHRQSRSIDESNPQYADFTSSQQTMRQGAVTDGMYYTSIDETGFKKNGLTPATTNPWPQMELEIANRFKDLTTTSGNLPILKDQIIAGLRSSEVQNDQTKVVLVDALDKLVSRNNVHQSVVQDAVRQVAKIVQDTKEVQKGSAELKTKSMIAMIDFLSKHGSNAFEPYSEDANAVRLALNSRMRDASQSTPVSVRIRANELYERQWQSVLNVMDHRPALSSSIDAKEKAKFLPTDLKMLEKDFLRNKLSDSRESVDEIVNSNVQGIIDATKGDIIKEGDSRLPALVELTNEKYHERIRMTAALALMNSETESQTAIGTLQKIALNSDTAAFRHDAIRALERSKIRDFVSDSDNQSAKDRLIAKLADVYSATPESEKRKMKIENLDREKLQGKSNADLIKLASDYIGQVKDGSRADLKYQAFEVRQSLYEFGSSLTNIGVMQMNAGPNSYAQAETNFKDGLTAFGLDASKLAELNKLFQNGYSKHQPLDFDLNSEKSPFKKMADQLTKELLKIEIYDDVKKMDGNLELHTNELPSLVLGLTKYAQLNANLSRNQGKLDIPRVDSSLALASLADVLTNRANPNGSGLRGESYTQIAGTLRTLAELGLRQGPNELSANFYKPCLEYFKKAGADFEAMKTLDPANLRTKAAHESLSKDMLEMQLGRLTSDTKRLDGLNGATLAWRTKEVSELSSQIDKQLDAHPHKDSADYHFKKGIKDIVDARRYKDNDKKQPLWDDAQKEILESIKIAAKENGVNSPAYNNSVNKLIELAKESKQPKIAEDFLKQGLDTADRTADGQLKMVMLRQYANFLHTQGRQAEKGQVLSDYNVEWVKQALAKSGGEVSPQLAGQIVKVRDDVANRCEEFLKVKDFGKAGEALNVCIDLDRRANKGKLTPEMTKYLNEKARTAEIQAATQLKAGEFKDIAAPFAMFLDSHRALNDGKLPEEILDQVRWISQSALEKADTILPDSESGKFDKAKFEQVEPLLKTALQAQQAELKNITPGEGAGLEAMRFSQTIQRLASGYFAAGKMPEAEAALQRAVDTISAASPVDAAAAVAALAKFYANQPDKVRTATDNYMQKLLASGVSNEDIARGICALVDASVPSFISPSPSGVASPVVASVVSKLNQYAANLPQEKRNQLLAAVGPEVARTIDRHVRVERTLGSGEKSLGGLDEVKALPKKDLEALTKESGILEAKRTELNKRLEPALVRTYNQSDRDHKAKPFEQLMQLYGQEKMDDAVLKLGQHHFSKLIQAGDLNQVLADLFSVNQHLKMTDSQAVAAKLTAVVASMIRDNGTALSAEKKETRATTVYPALINELAQRRLDLNQPNDLKRENREAADQLLKVIKDLSTDALDPTKKQTDKLLKDNPQSAEATESAARLALMYAHLGKSGEVKDLAESYVAQRLSKSSIEETLNGLGELCDVLAADPSTQGLVVEISENAIKSLESNVPKDDSARKQFYAALDHYLDYRISGSSSASHDNSNNPLFKGLRTEKERIRKKIID